MTILTNYQQFDGLHWETGTVRNYLDYVGVKAPHTGRPYSEALLMGVSGGAVMGYFSFSYEGYPPMARLLTRNTFDPWDTMLSRLGIVQDIAHTAKPEKGVANLRDRLESGVPAIVWADHFSLPYNNLPLDPGMWAMFPILVYGYDETAEVVHIADRARVPLTISPATLASARGRVKKDKFRIITLEPPVPDKLPAAVQAGIWDTIKLFTEKPPKGSRNNFGLQAYQWWIQLLTRPRTRLSWAKEFPAGRAMLAGLTSQFDDIHTFGKDSPAERPMYADFLAEAALILDRPVLNDVAAQFRRSGAAWAELGTILLPDSHPQLAECRRLIEANHRLFLDGGGATLAERQANSERQAALRDQLTADFGLTEAEVVAFRERIAAQVQRIHDIEADAIQQLKAAMA
ncbi:MAG: DUF4872 domain-containing protein [Anaerolineales bacterium]|nr:DUF4872 domain-containing protein [Anaerolineales bacterium]